jgi:general secretion pathway protein D
MTGIRRHLLAAVLLVLASAASGQEPVRVSEDGVMLDFQDADLRLVIAALAEAGSLNVVYGELPARRVTLRTMQPVPSQQIMALLRSLARTNGFEVVEDSGFVRIDGASVQSRREEQELAADDQAEEVRLYVHRLNHARAERLAATLQGLFGAAQYSAQPSQRSRTTLSQSLREQSIRPVDDPAAQPADSTGLQAPAQTSLRAELRGDIQIVADEATNSILVRAQPSDWEVIQDAIQALDLRPLQVLIEVVIAEVRETRSLDIGVSASASSTSSANRSTTGELAGGTQGDFTVQFTRNGTVDLDVALSALSAAGEVRILSRPVILAQNNQEAYILVGSERPFVQVSQSIPTNQIGLQQVVQYRDVGTRLAITPTINDDGYVNLAVTQEVSAATTETQFDAPVISTREAQTQLLARNGQTIVLGGLVDRQSDKRRSGIPLLKDIPILGYLFGSTREVTSNSELFLFLTPYIVANDDDADRLREEIEGRSDLLKGIVPIEPLLPRPIRLPGDTIRGGTGQW